MVIVLPEPLQKEAEALAKHEGIDLQALVVRAVEHFLREQQQPVPRVLEARQRLQELNRRKLKPDVDIVEEVRQVRAQVARLYLGEEELKQSRLYQVAEQSGDYDKNVDDTNETVS
jgi:hypothetical protein